MALGSTLHLLTDPKLPVTDRYNSTQNGPKAQRQRPNFSPACASFPLALAKPSSPELPGEPLPTKITPFPHTFRSWSHRAGKPYGIDYSGSTII